MQTQELPESAKKVFSLINEDELVDLCVRMANIRSPPMMERNMGEFVYGWYKDHGIPVKKVGMLESRFSVVGRLTGTGGGMSLLFNSHMDACWDAETYKNLLSEFPPATTGGYREGDRLFGYPLVNDRGPMACFMIAAKAIKEAGIKLKGDLVLTSVPGEIEGEPVDEYKGPDYANRDIGARYMVTHGVTADYALVAETTGFRIIRTMAGIAYFKITLYAGPFIYTPFLVRPTPLEKSPNAIVRMARVIEAVEKWALEYQERHAYKTANGDVIKPRANIGAIRGGEPPWPFGSVDHCSIYLDVRITPGEDIQGVKEEIRQLLVEKLGQRVEIELYAYRPGREAVRPEGLIDAIRRNHRILFNAEVSEHPAADTMMGMWRDINHFNEAGIPSVSYSFTAGFTGGNYDQNAYYTTIKDVVDCARVYALIAMDVCSQTKAMKSPQFGAPR